jgi:hypothetical protein
VILKRKIYNNISILETTIVTLKCHFFRYYVNFLSNVNANVKGLRYHYMIISRYNDIVFTKRSKREVKAEVIEK